MTFAALCGSPISLRCETLLSTLRYNCPRGVVSYVPGTSLEITADLAKFVWNRPGWTIRTDILNEESSLASVSERPDKSRFYIRQQVLEVGYFVTNLPGQILKRRTIHGQVRDKSQERLRW